VGGCDGEQGAKALNPRSQKAKAEKEGRSKETCAVVSDLARFYIALALICRSGGGGSNATDLQLRSYIGRSV
jgi:hypothetical protein